MYLIYIDESGDTGAKLNDPHKPKFGLVAALIHERSWVRLERELVLLALEIKEDLGLETAPRLHAWEMYQKRGVYASVTDDQRFGWMERVLEAAHEAQPRYFARILNKADQLVWLSDSSMTAFREAAAQGRASYDPYIGYFSHLMLDLQAILEEANELGMVFVDQHDRTRHLANLNIYRAWRLAGVADRLLEAPIQRDGRLHTLLAVPDFVGYVYLGANRDKERGKSRPHLKEWALRYIIPNVPGYKPKDLNVRRILAQQNFLLNNDDPSADLARTVKMVQAGLEALEEREAKPSKLTTRRAPF